MTKKPFDERTLSEVKWRISSKLFDLCMTKHKVQQLEGISEASEVIKKILERMLREAK